MLSYTSSKPKISGNDEGLQAKDKVQSPDIQDDDSWLDESRLHSMKWKLWILPSFYTLEWILTIIRDGNMEWTLDNEENLKICDIFNLYKLCIVCMLK